MAPTMNTRLHFTGVQPQIWITSTEGTADSTFLNGLLDSFRAGNVPTRTCWFDFGIPDDADPEDFQTILKWHPAAGLLWDIRQLRDFRNSSPATRPAGREPSATGATPAWPNASYPTSCGNPRWPRRSRRIKSTADPW